MALSQEMKLKVMEMRARGYSYAKIAEALGIAKQTAVDVARQNVEQVDTLRAIEMEAYFEERRLNKKGRIERLLALLDKLRKEIEDRDLKEVQTDRLITLLFKTLEFLKGEICQPEAQSTDEQQRDKGRREFGAFI